MSEKEASIMLTWQVAERLDVATDARAMIRSGELYRQKLGAWWYGCARAWSRWRRGRAA